MKILRAEYLVKTYGNGKTEIRALDDVSFAVESGEFVPVVGASGSVYAMKSPYGANEGMKTLR
ncbi:MAG: hypothetical protein K6G90_09280 [Clostridia bacterium]|nr:hypothetical protein [Clostridia bacterium]